MRRAITVFAAVAAVAMLLAGCGQLRERADGESEGAPCAEAGGHADGCEVPGYEDRPFSVFVPSSYSAASPTPVVLFLHGGGGNGVQAQETTCPDRDATDPACVQNVGEAEGFITVFPNGTGSRLLPEVRTWNGGGGGPDYACASGAACENNVDDVAYLNAVLDEVERQWNVDASRVYVSGFSNGGAMAHRVGCEMADRVAAIAPVSGGNEYATNADCSPTRPMPVIDVHGTADPCWTYVASTLACADQDPRPKVGVPETIAGWVERDGCARAAAETPLPDVADDGLTSVARTWTGCAGGVEVRLVTIDGGGHTFPSGSKARVQADTGPATSDFGFAYLWEFLQRFALA